MLVIVIAVNVRKMSVCKTETFEKSVEFFGNRRFIFAARHIFGKSPDGVGIGGSKDRGKNVGRFYAVPFS